MAAIVDTVYFFSVKIISIWNVNNISIQSVIRSTHLKTVLVCVSLTAPWNQNLCWWSSWWCWWCRPPPPPSTASPATRSSSIGSELCSLVSTICSAFEPPSHSCNLRLWFVPLWCFLRHLERSNLHQGGKPNVGLVTDQWSVIGVTLLSMTVLYAFLAVAILLNSSSWWEKLLILLLAPVLDPIATPRATVVKWPASPWWFGCWGGYEGFVAVHLVWMLFNDLFYRTQVYLGSNLWVRVSLTDSLYLVETWGPALEPMQVAPPDD